MILAGPNEIFQKRLKLITYGLKRVKGGLVWRESAFKEWVAPQGEIRAGKEAVEKLG